MQPVLQYVGEKVIEQLTLHVYYKNGTAESVLYDDGGEGYGYQEGQRTLRRFTVAGSLQELVLTQAIEGDYAPSYATYRVVLHGLPGPLEAKADGQAAEMAEVTLETGLVLPSLVVPVGFGEVRVSAGAAEVAAPVA
jgi:alpha-glucosidase